MLILDRLLSVALLNHLLGEGGREGGRELGREGEGGREGGGDTYTCIQIQGKEGGKKL